MNSTVDSAVGRGRTSAPILLFELNGQRYGIPLSYVEEVQRMVASVRLPQAPAIVEGIIDCRGKVVPVLDIRGRFRLPAKAVAVADHLVLAHARGRLVAIRVDRALDLIGIDTDKIEDACQVAPVEYVSGVAKLPDGLVLIHDLDTFLSEAEAEAVAKHADEAGAG